MVGFNPDAPKATNTKLSPQMFNTTPGESYGTGWIEEYKPDSDTIRAIQNNPINTVKWAHQFFTDNKPVVGIGLLTTLSEKGSIDPGFFHKIFVMIYMFFAKNDAKEILKNTTNLEEFKSISKAFNLSNSDQQEILDKRIQTLSPNTINLDNKEFYTFAIGNTLMDRVEKGDHESAKRILDSYIRDNGIDFIQIFTRVMPQKAATMIDFLERAEIKIDWSDIRWLPLFFQYDCGGKVEGSDRAGGSEGKTWLLEKVIKANKEIKLNDHLKNLLTEIPEGKAKDEWTTLLVGSGAKLESSEVPEDHWKLGEEAFQVVREMALPK